MTQGTKKAEVHEVFRKRLTELVENAQKASDGFTAKGQRAWFIPSDLEAESVLDVPQLHKPSFDRQPINTNYEQCFQDEENPGTVGDVIALKQQVDYNAAEERAFRLRHASVCRCLTHSHGRRFGEAVGPALTYVEETIADMITAGAAE